MKINQVFIGVSFFKRDILSKWKLKGYTDINKPVIFYGLYRKQINYLKRHRGMAVVVWRGSDILRVMQDRAMVNYLRKRKNTYFVAISNFIASDMDRMKLKYIQFPVTSNRNTLNPKPLGKSIYTYSSPHNKTFYGQWYITKLQKRFPDINFIMAFKDTFSKQKLRKIYENCFLGLRLTKHDGLSNTVLELGLMGRKVVWNGNSPNAVHYSSIKDIEKVILQEQKKIGKTNTRLAEKVQKYMAFNDDWLYTEFYTGGKIKKEEVDFSPINVTDLKRTFDKRKKLYDVTVIINTINEDPVYLRKAIESYKNQKWVKVHILISTVIGDKSIDMAKKMKCDVYINTKKGIYRQLNKAIKQIKGEWYCYASGNDVALPAKLYTEIMCCLKYDKKICYSNFIRANENLNNGRTTNFHEYNFTRHLNGNFVNDCALIHHTIIKKYAPFQWEKWGNHAYHDFWLRVHEGEGNVFCFNPKPTWVYRVTNNSKHVKRNLDPGKKQANIDLALKLRRYHERIS